MKKSIAALGALLAIAACGDSSGPGNAIPGELVGSWVAEPACVPACGLLLVSVANSTDSVNLTSFGITTRVTLTDRGRIELSSSVTGAPSVGTARTEGALLIVTDPAGPVDTMDYTAHTDRLELRFRRIFHSYDFTGDGQNDPGRAIWRLRRD